MEEEGESGDGETKKTRNQENSLGKQELLLAMVVVVGWFSVAAAGKCAGEMERELMLL